MKNIIKYILVLIVCLIAVGLFTGCKEKNTNAQYVSPQSNIVSTRNDNIIAKSANADTFTVKYNMDKETDSFVQDSIQDMKNRGYHVVSRKEMKQNRILSSDPIIFYGATEYIIVTYEKVR